MTIRQTFQIGFALAGVGGEPSLHLILAIAVGSRRADSAHELENLAERNSKLDEMGRQREDFTELAIVANQLQVRIEHRDSLPHMVQRGLENFAIEMQRGVRVVEQLEGGLG